MDRRPSRPPLAPGLRAYGAPLLEEIHARLAGVVVECLPYAEIIARYDGPETLFYLDPPYLGGEDDYGEGLFERADFARLAEILSAIEGRFLLSVNDTPGLRAIFAGFEIEPVATTYTIARGGGDVGVHELIISDAGPTDALPGDQMELV